MRSIVTSNGEVIVTLKDIKRAKRQAEDYKCKLGKYKSIGFRKPDLLNLERAIIAASAILGPKTNKSEHLNIAIEQTMQHGGKK